MIEVTVHYSDVGRAFPVLRKMMQREGRALLSRKKCHIKKSEEKAKKKVEARKKMRQQQHRRKWCN